MGQRIHFLLAAEKFHATSGEEESVFVGVRLQRDVKVRLWIEPVLDLGEPVERNELRALSQG